MNALYARLHTMGHAAEIKMSRDGWRVYLLDARGQRTGAAADVVRTTSDTTAAVNARLRGARGFRRDSRMHAVLTALVEHCERTTLTGCDQ
ncbi:hypothetical protein [Hydrogenophaga sp.]|uniref:hypothetical protein n=1 Tax=Hydrogenophaga sp. TaxID=1904254 RepID=UPI003D287592